MFSDSSEACRNKEVKEGVVEECPEDDNELVRERLTRDGVCSFATVRESIRSLSAASAAVTGAIMGPPSGRGGEPLRFASESGISSIVTRRLEGFR